jgi:hypothetical protein
MQGAWMGVFSGTGVIAMQDLGYELPRILIPRTPVNKSKRRAGATMPGPFNCAYAAT